MPRINRIEITINTGQSGWEGPVCLEFNGHQLPIDLREGSAEAGGHLVGECQPNSFAHSVHLVGPQAGKWDIDELSVTYDVTAGDEYSVRFGAITLDETQSLDIWQERPLPTFDV